jgi:hypothetical protein
MNGKSTTIAYRWRYWLYLAIGNLIAAIVFNPPAPARAYEGIFEMFGHAWNSFNQANEEVKAQQAVPIDSQGNSRTAENPWEPYVPSRVVTEAEWAHFNQLKLPQRRDTLGRVIGPPRQVNYASVDGYEDHRLFDGRTIEITYQYGTDQRGQQGWVAIATEVR